MAKTPVIKISNLSKKFMLGDVEVQALQSVSLEIYSGEFICFFGPSGCGKSTLMSMIAGLQPPSTGSIIIRGVDLAKMKPNELAEHRRTKIGMVFQAFNLIQTMNVLENIALPLTFARIGKSRRMKRAENLLEIVGMSKYKNRTPAQLSGGQQQHIAIARSLVANPWIMLADEPTGNLDSKSANEVMRLLISLNRKSKRTVILITHNPDYIKYADRIFWMQDGKVIKVEANANVATSFEGTKELAPKKKKGKGEDKDDTPEEELPPEKSPDEKAPDDEKPDNEEDAPTADVTEKEDDFSVEEAAK